MLYKRINIQMDKQLLDIAHKSLLNDFLSIAPEVIPRSALEGLRLKGESTVITGVRRCGKSFFMKLIAQKLSKQSAIFYLNFDDPRLINFSSEDFEVVYQLWLSSLPSPPVEIAMFFDEPQNIPQWEKWINHFASKPNHIVVITGSNSEMLSSDLATFLTGRHRVIELNPLSFAEVAKSNQAKRSKINEPSDLLRLFQRYQTLGGFPRVWLTEETTLLGQYFKDIVLKDISTRKGAASSRVNLELGLTLMTSAANLFNKTNVAKQLGFKQQRTISRHVAVFLDCYLFAEVRLFSAALKKQQRNLPKYYPVDHALARHTRFSVFDDQSLSLEIMIVNELRRRGYEIYYWKSKEGFEVDFIARKLGAATLAIQACIDISSNEVLERETRALQACNKELKMDQLLLITIMDSRELSFGSKTAGKSCKIQVIPFMDWSCQSAD